MATFTIDTDNNIVAHVGVPCKAENQEVFSSEAELTKLAVKWAAIRLIKIWNGFAGAAPFNDLKPVKKFTSRKQAVRRLWQAIARFEPLVAPVQNKRPTVKKKPPVAVIVQPNRKPGKAASLQLPSTKKAQVIAMMRHSKGATLESIMESTGWQEAHRTRLHKYPWTQGRHEIDSSKNAAGHRSYRIAQ